jgi:transposase
MWWSDNCNSYSFLEELIIELDGGSAIRSNRTQFIKRIVEFSRSSNLKIKLLYYPPYHSKYNTIERCWACLENYWNGAILDSIETAIAWAQNMTWKGIKPLVTYVDKIYEKGIIPSTEDLEFSKQFWFPSIDLPSWDITIIPTG